MQNLDTIGTMQTFLLNAYMNGNNHAHLTIYSGSIEVCVYCNTEEEQAEIEKIGYKIMKDGYVIEKMNTTGEYGTSYNVVMSYENAEFGI